MTIMLKNSFKKLEFLSKCDFILNSKHKHLIKFKFQELKNWKGLNHKILVKFVQNRALSNFFSFIAC
jgi:hypothetical protein